jgi:hypothetical protein
MRSTVLTVIAIAAFCTACASQPPHYALVTSTFVIESNARRDIEELRALRDQAATDLLWFERNGSEYVVTDAATVAQALEALSAIKSVAALRRISGSAASFGLKPVSTPWSTGGFAPHESATPTVESSTGGVLNADQKAESWQALHAPGVTNLLPASVREPTVGTDWGAMMERAYQASVNRAHRNLGRVLDDAMANGVAQKVAGRDDGAPFAQSSH